MLADCRFMCYLPSVIATATMLLVIRNVEPFDGVDYQTELLGILGIDKVTIFLLIFTSKLHCLKLDCL